MSAVVYRRIAHAAHYGSYGAPGTGHDLEEWDVEDRGDVARARRTGDPVAPEGVPSDAAYHSGYRKDGVQHWIFVRRAPFSGTCEEHGCPNRRRS